VGGSGEFCDSETGEGSGEDGAGGPEPGGAKFNDIGISGPPGSGGGSAPGMEPGTDVAGEYVAAAGYVAADE